MVDTLEADEGIAQLAGIAGSGHGAELPELGGDEIDSVGGSGFEHLRVDSGFEAVLQV